MKDMTIQDSQPIFTSTNSLQPRNEATCFGRLLKIMDNVKSFLSEVPHKIAASKKRITERISSFLYAKSINYDDKIVYCEKLMKSAENCENLSKKKKSNQFLVRDLDDAAKQHYEFIISSCAEKTEEITPEQSDKMDELSKNAHTALTQLLAKKVADSEHLQ